MKYDNLINIVKNEPVFTTGMLLAGQASPGKVRLQLSRWVKAGKVIKLRNGLYALAKPFFKSDTHLFYFANQVTRPSYVSLQSGLGYYGLIPENVPVVTSITTSRPGEVSTGVGSFIYRHVNKRFFTGFSLVNIYKTQSVYLASAEKCLLDLIYLTPAGGTRASLEGLRLQNLASLNLVNLEELAQKLQSKKLHLAVKNIKDIAAQGEYETL